MPHAGGATTSIRDDGRPADAFIGPIALALAVIAGVFMVAGLVQYSDVPAPSELAFAQLVLSVVCLAIGALYLRRLSRHSRSGAVIDLREGALEVDEVADLRPSRSLQQ